MARTLFQAWIAVKFEHDLSADYLGPRNLISGKPPEEFFALARRTVQRWCDWLDALIHQPSATEDHCNIRTVPLFQHSTPYIFRNKKSLLLRTFCRFFFIPSFSPFSPFLDIQLLNPSNTRRMRDKPKTSNTRCPIFDTQCSISNVQFGCSMLALEHLIPLTQL